MTDFVKMILKPKALERLGLPEYEYPVPKDLVTEVALQGFDIAPEYLLCWMHEYSSTLSEGWTDLEIPMTGILSLVAPENPSLETTVQGDDWYLEIGPVDLTGSVVTFQRGGRVLAAFSEIENGKLRLATYAPLDADCLRRIYQMAKIPDPEYGICLGYDTNWEFSLGLASKTYSAFTKLAAGKSYVSIWEFGLGINHDKTQDDDYFKQRDLEVMPAVMVAMQLGIYYEIGEI